MLKFAALINARTSCASPSRTVKDIYPVLLELIGELGDTNNKIAPKAGDIFLSLVQIFYMFSSFIFYSAL